MYIQKYGRHFAVLTSDGALVGVAVYRKGAQAFITAIIEASSRRCSTCREDPERYDPTATAVQENRTPDVSP